MNAKTSYLQITEAQNYFNGRFDTTAWDRANPVDQLKALVQASTDIDKLNYLGFKSDSSQEHEFPRGRADLDVMPGIPDTDGVPLEIKYAVCEQAYILLDGWDSNREIDGLNIEQKIFGDVKTIFNRDTIPMNLRAGISAQAFQFVSPFLRDSREVTVLKV